jgi:hypothetical protein
MLTRRVVLVAILAAGALAHPGAAAFWDEKPYTAWTLEEMNRLVTDSPWSGRARVTKADGWGVRRDHPEALVTWTTARPMREVLVRERLGAGGTFTKDMEAFLVSPANFYVVSLRISAPPGESYAAYAKAALAHTALHFDEWRSPLTAMTVETAALESESQLVIVFTFPRGFGITVEHKNVQFKTRLGSFNITKKFNLKNMVYRGELAL